ncbi:DUF4340 domain-containing protein [Atopomonas sediminilitoris]|uniref:DUF4340 domain-containing protein n=1 Tax=Atopomonas sediminilitoris TaxID=2919919 RepID=UPI001F4EC47B|nr:DUF4340 domain-containing protein [Atopomonas sediminilitoris]MCJ8168856.1 DUF4340 domain-containing protein [Atopomonas sediminilitoris]
MGHRNLWFLLAATALMLLAIFSLRQEDNANSGSEVLFSDLKLRAPSLNRITVNRGEAPKIELRLRQGQWLMTSENGYPADTLPVTELLRNLGEAKRIEAKTSNPEYHARLGLADPDSAEGAATLLTLKFIKGAALKLLVGNAGQSGGQLVRLPGDKQVWLLDKPLLLPSSDMDWLNNEILSMPLQAIKSLHIEHAKGESVTVARDNAQQINFRVAELGEASLNHAAVNSMVNVFTVLGFAEVAPAEQLTFASKPLLQFTLDSFVGDQVQGAIYAQGESHWLRLSKRAPAAEGSTLKLTAPEGWLFRLQPYQAQALNKTAEQLKQAPVTQ